MISPPEAVLIGLASIIIPCLAYNCFCAAESEEADDNDTADRRRCAPQSATPVVAVGVVSPISTSIGRGGSEAPRPPVEMPPRWKEWPAAVMCMYRRADGSPETKCAVCLAELADGVNVRVLPVCMHYFHADCVGEWLRAHQTCPLCRAPLYPAVAGAPP